MHLKMLSAKWWPFCLSWLLSIGLLGTNFSEWWIKIQHISFKTMHLKMLFAKWWPFCLDLNVLRHITWDIASVMASQTTSSFIACSGDCLGTWNKGNKPLHYWTFMRVIHRWLVNSLHEGPVMWMYFAVTTSSWRCWFMFHTLKTPWYTFNKIFRLLIHSHIIIDRPVTTGNNLIRSISKVFFLLNTHRLPMGVIC